ncbi:GspH/FimT family pseudopilin [Xanthomonas sp. 60]
MSLRRPAGFTLVELMVTVAVVAILAAIAFPSFQTTLRSNRVATANNEILGLVNLARSEAIRSGRGGGVCGSTNGGACDGAWGQGLLAFTDPEGEGTLGDAGTALRFMAVNPDTQITGPDEEIAFDGRGRRRASADQVISLRPRTCTENMAQQRELVINASGQLRSSKAECS